jgi:hypothetical protein
VKVVLVTREQFAALWTKLQPQQRIMVDEMGEPCLSLKAQGVNAVVMVRGTVEAVEYPEREELRLVTIHQMV